MKNLFVPYELALKAKESGFDEITFAAYNPVNKKLVITDWENIESNDDILVLRKFNSDKSYDSDLFAAPTYQQLIDWFREKHNIHISISSIADLVHENDEFSPNGCFSALLEDVTVGKVFNASNTLALVSGKYDYNQAVIAGLEKAFKLIKK